MKRITILGSTGSIGRSTLDVISRNSSRFKVVALAAGRNVDLLEEQVRAFRPDIAAVADQQTAEELSRRVRDSWSIQENTGHFLATESLFLGRLDDYENDAPVLRPARFEDNPTDQVDFNNKDIHWILDEFRAQREVYLSRLQVLSLEDFGKAILHPRLNKPMRLCDMLFFHSAHDQHHLARIVELKELWQTG